MCIYLPIPPPPPLCLLRDLGGIGKGLGVSWFGLFCRSLVAPRGLGADSAASAIVSLKEFGGNWQGLGGQLVWALLPKPGGPEGLGSRFQDQTCLEIGRVWQGLGASWFGLSCWRAR